VALNRPGTARTEGGVRGQKDHGGLQDVGVHPRIFEHDCQDQSNKAAHEHGADDNVEEESDPADDRLAGGFLGYVAREDLGW
jgi:hypothetical protein